MIKYFGIFLLLVSAGCGPINAEQLRANPGGVHAFTVSADYKAIYQKILSHAESCSKLGAFGDNAVVKGELFDDAGRSSISITNSRAFGVATIFTIDISQADGGTTEVKVYYDVHRHKPTALLIEDWIKKNSKDCTRGKIVLECAC